MGCGVSQTNLNTVSLPSNDRYDRKELIGVGHHGRVYKSFYQLDKKQYANKVIDQFRSNTNLMKVQEGSSILINRLKKLRNQRIATYYQIDFTQKQVSIIMELAKEGTLKKYIQKNGAQSEENSSKYIQGILQGLDYLHNAGVLHKDLKSTNILLMQKNEIKVCDYGIAEIYDDRLTENKDKNYINKEIDYYRGESLPYMAPEVIKNIEVIDKSDVWSLGCILVELITGETPWIKIAQNFEKIFQTISRGAVPPLPKNISKECQHFLQSCLAVIPTQRLSVSDLLQHKFITKYSKNSPLFFEEDTSLQNIKVTLEKPQKDKKGQHKADKSSKQLQNYLNDSLNLKRGQKTETNSALKALTQNKQSRQQRRSKISREIDENFNKIRQAMHSMDEKIKKKPQAQQILQQKPNQQLHTVILNNKKIQLDPVKYKNNINHHKKVKTQQNEWNSPPRDKSRSKNSMQIEKLSLDSSKQYYDPFKNHSSNFEDSLDTELKRKNIRLETQPNISQYSDREYFKRPLKLLKKKLKQTKQSNQFSRKLTSEFNQSIVKKDLAKLQQEQKEDEFSPLAKIRVYTQTKRQQRVIDTELARAERDMFISQQKIMKKLRDEERNKWEQQLKKGAQILKKQLKQYYVNPHPLLV